MLSKKNKTHAHHNKKNIVKKKDLAKAQGFISLLEAANLCSYSQEYISLLVRKKLLQGEKIGRNWFTKKEWLEKYILEHPAEKKGNTKGELKVEKVFKERIVEIPINKNLKSLRQDFSVWLKNFFIAQKNIFKNNLLYNVRNIINKNIYSKNNNGKWEKENGKSEMEKNMANDLHINDGVPASPADRLRPAYSGTQDKFFVQTKNLLFQRVIISTVIFSLLLTTASAQFFAAEISRLGDTMESVAEKNNTQILNGINLVKEKIEVDRVLERFATASENFSATAEYKIKKIAGNGNDKKENVLGSLNQDDSRQSLEPTTSNNLESTTGQVAGVQMENGKGEEMEKDNPETLGQKAKENKVENLNQDGSRQSLEPTTGESILNQAKNITEKISESVTVFVENILVAGLGDGKNNNTDPSTALRSARDDKTGDVSNDGIPALLPQLRDEAGGNDKKGGLVGNGIKILSDKNILGGIAFNFLGLPKNSDQIFGGLVLGANDLKQTSQQKFLKLLANLQVATSKKLLAKNSSTESVVEKVAKVFFKSSKKTSDFVYDNIFTPIAGLGNMLGGSIITGAKNVGVKIGIYQTDWLERELQNQDTLVWLIKRDRESSVNNFYDANFYNLNGSEKQVIVLKGEKGETGERGEKGETGEAGANGLPGKDGSGIGGNTSVTNIYQVGTPGSTASQGAGTVLDVKYLGAGNLSVSDKTTLNTLTVTGVADFNNAVNIAGNLTLSGATASGGNFTTSGNILGGGYLKIGNGTPDWTLGNGSGYFTSNIETDGSLRIDSTTTTDPYLWLTSNPVASAENSALLFGSKLVNGSSVGTLIGSNVSDFSGDFLNFQVNDVSKFKIDSEGNISSVGWATHSGSMTVESTTTPQLTIGYDSNHVWNSAVDNKGNIFFSLISATNTPEFNFVNPVNISLATATDVDIFNITASTTKGIIKIVASTTEPLITLNQTGAGGGIIFLNNVQASSTVALLQYTDNPLNFGAANGTFIAANPDIFSGNWLDFQVAGTRYFSLASDGDIFSAGGMLINTNSTTALSVQDSLGNTHFVIDTISGKYGFATSTPNRDYGLTIATSTLQYGDWTLIGNATTTGTVAGGNLSIGGDVTLGDSGTDRIVFNGYVLSDIIPADNARSLGSSVNRWNYGYFDSINVNELNAGGTNISGTASNEIVINSSNVSDDTEDASVVFERGTPVTNAAVRWDASENNINFNFPIWVEGTDTTGQASSTITVKAGINQGNYNLFQIKDVDGNNLVQADPVGHFAVGGDYQDGYGVTIATSTYFVGDAVFANGSTFNSITTTDSAYLGGNLTVIGDTFLNGGLRINTINSTTTNIDNLTVNTGATINAATLNGLTTIADARVTSFNATTTKVDNLTVNSSITLPAGALSYTSLNWYWATSSEEYFWNNTSTWSGFESEWNKYTNASSTLITLNDIDTSLKISDIVTDETGSGSLVFALSPTISGATLNNLTTIADARVATLNATSSVIDSLVVNTGATINAATLNGLSTISDARITVLNATSSTIDTLTVNTAINLPAGSISANDLALTEGYIFRGEGGYAEATSTIFIADSGNVGIGKTNPSYALDITGGMQASSDVGWRGGSGWLTSAEIRYNTAADFNITNTNSGGSISFNPGNSEAMRLLSSGSVGIATTTPTSRLTIQGAGATSATYGLNIADSTGRTYFEARNDGVTRLYPATGTLAVLELMEPDGTSGIQFRTGPSGSRSMYIGIGAGQYHVSSEGVNNTAFGYQAMDAVMDDADNNVALGTYALGGLTTGDNNAALGANSLTQLTTGSNNLAQGFAALGNITTQGHNIGMGAYAAYLTTGSNNTVIGGLAMGRTTGDVETASANTIVGYSAGYNITTADNNSLYGNNAGKNLTTGANNILLGYQSGESLTTGTKNIVIGYDIDTPAVDSTNTLNIGNILFGTGLTGSGTSIAGNIGIATSTPGGYYGEKLTVVGGAYITGGATTTALRVASLNVAGDDVSDITGSGLAIVNGALTVQGFALSGSNGAWENIWTNTLTPTSTTAGIFVNASSTINSNFRVQSDQFEIPRFVVGSSTATNLYVASNGNVGVGTASPSGILDIVGNDSARPFTARYGSTAGEGLPANLPNYLTSLFIRNNSSAYGNRVTYIGGSQGSTGLTFGDKDSYNAGSILYNNFNDSLSFRVNEVDDVLHINSSGNVGIATTTPGGYYGEKLTVVGGAYITGGATTTALRVSSLNVGGDDVSDITGSGLAVVDGALTVQGFALSGSNGAWENIWTNTLTPTSTTAGIFVNASSTFNSTLGVNGNFTVASGATTTIGNNALVVRGGDGRVGIGVENPTTNLDVYSTDSSSIYARSSTAAGYMTAGSNIVQFGSQTYDDFQIMTNSNLAIAIKKDTQNVGIATTTPYAKLSVVSDDYNLPKFMVASSTGFKTPSLYVASNGNVGVGTAAPAAKLHIQNNAISGTQLLLGELYHASVIVNNTGNPTTGISITGYNSSGVDKFNVASNGSTYFNGCNVGIATTTPYAKLSVVSDDYNLPKFMVASSTGFTTPALYVASNGNVGVGTGSPSVNLDILSSGDARVNITGNNSGKDSGIYLGIAAREWKIEQQNYNTYGNSAYDLEIGYHGAMLGGNLLLVRTGGNVGIATTTPGGTYGEKLTVVGGAYITGGATTTALRVSSLNVGGDDISDITGTGLAIVNGALSVQGFALSGANGAWENIWTNTLTPTSTTAGIFVNASSTFNSTLGVNGNFTVASGATTTIGSNALVVRGGDGNVGVGTASPSTKFEVNGNLSLIGEPATLYFDASQALTYISGRSGGGGNAFINFVVNGEKMRITRDNGIGIATTTPGGYYGEKLTVQGGAYIQNNTAEQAKFVVGSSTATSLYVASNGNVGIGKTNPAYPLDVNGNVNITGYLETSGQVVADTYLKSSKLLNLASENLTIMSTTANYDIIFGNGNGSTSLATEWMRIKNGNVGIATTTPGGYYGEKLTVVGGAYIQNNTAEQAKFVVGSSTATSLYVASNGNVGIGTASPASTLQAENSTGAILTLSRNDTNVLENDILGQIDFLGNDSSYTNSGVGAFIRFRATQNQSNLSPWGNLEFGTSYANVENATTRMVISADGKVGIGDTNPSAKLQVAGAISGQYFTATSTSASSTMAHSLVVDTTTLVVNANEGRVGIGTANPATPLHIMDTSYSGLRLGYNDSTYTNLYVTNTGELRINATMGGMTVYGNSTFTSPLTFNYGAVINEGGNDSNTRIEGDNDTHLFFVDGSADAIGIGGYTDLTGATGKLLVNGNVGIATTTPGGTYGEKLTVVGGAYITGGATTTALRVASLNVNGDDV